MFQKELTMENRTASLLFIILVEAVLNTGEKQHVFLALGQGRFDPRGHHASLSQPGL